MDQSDLNRRTWLTQATLAMAGGAMLTGAKAPAQEVDLDERRQRFLRGECPQILRVSKSLEGPIVLSPQGRCPCECEASDPPQTIFQIDFRSILDFKSSAPCDETNVEPLLQDGVELWAEGSMELRLARCPAADAPELLIGHSRTNCRVHRYRPNQDIFVGEACATVGFDPARRDQRCCAAGLFLGSVCCEGVNTMSGWSLTLTFRATIDGLDPQTICNQQELRVQSIVDGVLVGPCVKIPHE